MRTNHEEPVRTLLVGDLLETRLRTGIDLRPELLALGHNGRLVLILEIEVGTVKDRARTISVVQGAATFTVALDDHLARLLTRRTGAETNDVLELRIARGS